MASLYELTQDFLMVAQQLEEMDLDEETIQDTLESLKQPIEKKAENIIKFVKNIEAMAAARETEAKRLKEAAASDLKKAEKLIRYLDETLQQLDINNLTAGPFQLKYKQGSEIVEIDEVLLPKEFWIVEEVKKPLPKPELKKLIKAGRFIPGANIIRNSDKLVIK